MKRMNTQLCLLTTALLFAGCGGSDVDSEQTKRPEPTLSVEDWTFERVGVSGLRALIEQNASEGKITVIDCWATWCTSCVAMFPKLHKAMDERGDKVRLVSLCYDEGDEYVAQAKQYLTDQHATSNARIVDPAAKDDLAGVLSEEWGGAALPAVFVFNAEGELVYELLETRGGVSDWVAEIVGAVDKAAD